MVRVGIIGCGGISDSHRDGFHKTGRAAVTCVYDVAEEIAREKAEKWGARVCSSAQELVDSVIDIVVIATPGFAHREYVELAAAAGRHILCEKPVALNLDDAEAIRDAVATSGVTFMSGFSQRFDAPLVQLRAVQESGRIGGAVTAFARLHAPASSERWRQIEQAGHWRASMELSGGRINEFCSHSINWLLWVLGRPKTVYGRAFCVTEGFSLDDADLALIECERGTGLLEVHRHAGVALERNYGIVSHGGSVVLKDDAVRVTLMDEEPVEEPVGEAGSKHAHFLDCIESGAEPLTSIDDSIDTLRVCLAFNRSAASGQVEQV